MSDAMGQPSPATSSVEQARQKALDLSQQRKAIDAQISTHAEVLKREGVTLNSSLLDAEGYPLNSVDIPSIREARSKIIALQNDRKDIDGQLRQLLEVALAAPSNSSSSSSAATDPQMLSIARMLNEQSGRTSTTQPSDGLSTPSREEDIGKEGGISQPPCGRACKVELNPNDQPGTSARALLGSLAFLDRFLTIWIILAMIIGVIIGEFASGVQEAFTSKAQFQGVAAPLIVGLIVMMWPILTKVQYERFPEIFQTRRIWTHIALSVALNWILAPFLMTGLAWATLPDLPTYRAGIILVGIARCIAMVNIWAALAKGDTDVCAILVIVNSVLQMVLFSPYSLLLINVIGGVSAGDRISLDYSHVATAVALYLGVPLAAGIATRFLVIALIGRKRFQTRFLPYFGPLSLLALLYVIIVIFALQAKHVLHNLGPTFRCFVPLVLYFFIMWLGTFTMCWYLARRTHPRGSKTWDYPLTVVQSFTAASNNFELAIAIAVSAYGANSDQALAATIGPLVEIPVLVSLTYVSLWLGRKLNWGRKGGEDKTAA